MPNMKRYELVAEVMAELAPEIEAANSSSHKFVLTKPINVRPSLNQVLAEYSPLPREALFLGVASDRLPVLLNLMDPVPGPVMIVGDDGCGKTNFLHMIARATDEIHDYKDVQYGVITDHPEEWNGLGNSQNCVEIFAAYKNQAQDFVNTLTNWAHTNRGEKQCVLLLVDDLSIIAKMDFETRQNLRWLLQRGPARRVWPIVTLNPKQVVNVEPWLDFFHTRLFGRIENSSDIKLLAGSIFPSLQTINSSYDFQMREGENWLKFWIPSVD